MVILEQEKKNKQENEWWKSQKDWTLAGVLPNRYRLQLGYINNRFIPFLKSDFHVVDIACACGEWDFFIADRVKEIDAFDLSPQMIETARETARQKNIRSINFAEANALTLELTKKYDAAMMLGLLTCLWDTKEITKLVRKLNASLKAGARLIVKDTLAHKGETMYHYNYRTKYQAVYHNKEWYINLFTSNGFKLLDWEDIARKDDIDPNYLSFCGIFERQV
jgi:ubiquinone/menaquinone biosynthesis C-methylase UbiE